MNVMAVGDAGCGKTCLFTSFLNNPFLEKHIPVNLHSGDVDCDSDNEDVDIDNEVVIISDKNELKISFFSTSGETCVRLARLCCHV